MWIRIGIGIGLYLGVSITCNFITKKLLNFNNSWLWLFWPLMLAGSIAIGFSAGVTYLVEWLGNEFLHMIGRD